MDLDKIEETMVKAGIDLPVGIEDCNGNIESHAGTFILYVEGGASSEQVEYVTSLINNAPEMIALIRKQEAALRQSQASYGKLAMELAAAKAPACADPVVETNVALLRSRSTLGIEKYGTTLADSKAPLRDFLEHALLELLDGANYLQTAMRKIDAAPAPATPAASVDTAND